jgi:pimeloyl-ACP methyl ester carboxylesterase
LDAAIQLEPTPVVLVGWSIGAMLSLQAAVRLSSCPIGGLILISGTPQLSNSRVLRAMGMQLQRRREQVLEDFARLCVAQDTPEPGADASDFVARFLEMAGRVETGQLAAGLQYLRDTDLRLLLPRIAVPTAVIHGRADMVIPCEGGQALTQSIPGASLDLIADAGHALPFTHPRRIARAIREVIHGCPTAR